MKCLPRRRWLAAVVLALSLFAPPAFAQWPERTVTIVVPYAAGGNTDTMARMAADWLNSRFSQRFIVENRVGAGATLAAGYVAAAKPDGYTVLFAASPQILVSPHAQKVNYDSKTSFAFVGIFGTGPNILAVHKDVPAKTVQELIAYGKANPGKISYASGGHGTHGHLTGALFAARAGIEMVHVPYKGGSQSTTDLLAGQVQMYFGNASELLPHANSDRVRLLAVSTPTRMVQLPNIPAVAEIFPGFDMASWNGFLAPAGTPQPILEKLASEIVLATKDPKIAQRLSELGIVPGGTVLDDFTKLVDSQRPGYAEAVKLAGLKPLD
jgi:tripartite-type tricarboxylate transporter receptor subunit TctC